MKHGLGAVAALGEEAQALGMRRPLLVTDPGIVRAGLLDRAVAPLRAARLDYAVFDRVAPNPPIALVDEGAELYRRERCDGVIGFGGGSSMDVAKAIGVVATNGGSILDGQAFSISQRLGSAWPGAGALPAGERAATWAAQYSGMPGLAGQGVNVWNAGYGTYQGLQGVEIPLPDMPDFIGDAVDWVKNR